MIAIVVLCECDRRDLNSYDICRRILNPVRIPIPPLSQKLGQQDLNLYYSSQSAVCLPITLYPIVALRVFLSVKCSTIYNIIIKIAGYYSLLSAHLEKREYQKNIQGVYREVILSNALHLLHIYLTIRLLLLSDNLRRCIECLVDFPQI
mgnify:FL=1